MRDRPGHDRRYALDVSKIVDLGWVQRNTCEQAIESTVRWYVDNEWWWRPIKNGELYREYFSRQYKSRGLQ